jgi:Fic family protein
MNALDYEKLRALRDAAIEKRNKLPGLVVEKFERAFIIEYTHHSTALEGNTLSLAEVKLILEDGSSVGGKPLRETYEVSNHEKAYVFVGRLISQGRKLDEEAIKDIHQLLMENIMPGGIYRNCDVRITGAKHKPPKANDVFYQMKSFAADLYDKYAENAVVSAAWTHAEFVRIHPFADGNGRTARLLMNFRLLENDFLPVSIPRENRLAYYDALEAYDLDGDIFPFTELVFELEKGRLEEFLD